MFLTQLEEDAYQKMMDEVLTAGRPSRASIPDLESTRLFGNLVLSFESLYESGQTREKANLESSVA